MGGYDHVSYAVATIAQSGTTHTSTRAPELSTSQTAPPRERQFTNVKDSCARFAFTIEPYIRGAGLSHT